VLFARVIIDLPPILWMGAILGIVLAFIAISAFLKSRNTRLKNQAYLLELIQLREEVARLREDNERMKRELTRTSTSIKAS
jgi:cell shape-determining protein MreC